MVRKISGRTTALHRNGVKYDIAVTGLVEIIMVKKMSCKIFILVIGLRWKTKHRYSKSCICESYVLRSIFQSYIPRGSNQMYWHKLLLILIRNSSEILSEYEVGMVGQKRPYEMFTSFSAVDVKGIHNQHVLHLNWQSYEETW